MERAEHVVGSAGDRGIVPFVRVLMRFGMNLVGIPGEESRGVRSTWWGDDRQELDAGAWWQSELWSAEPKLPIEEQKPETDSIETTVFVVNHDDAEPRSVATTRTSEAEHPETRRGTTMSMFTIAKFMKVNGSLYNGEDRRRWFALPAQRDTPKFQLMSQPHAAVRSPKAKPHDFSGLNLRRTNLFLAP